LARPDSPLSASRIHICGHGLRDHVFDRISIADGTQSAAGVRESDSEFPFAGDARIPIQQWRTLSPDEGRQLSADEAAPQVWILKVPDALLEPLLANGVQGITKQSEADLFIRQPHLSDSLANILEFGKSLAVTPTGLKLQGMGVRPPGLITTTVDKERSVRIGLHMDSWDRLHPRETRRARNRLNINLGSGNRYLLLVDMPVDTIFSNGREGSDKAIRGSSGLARDFLERNPQHPVLKLCIRPFEAYIAPTELLPHDSSTLDKREADVSLTMLGHFGGPTTK